MVEGKIGAAILHGTADAVVASDRAGNITFWNPGAARIFGFAASEALGRSLDIIIPENLRARHWEGYDRMMATGESRYSGGELLSVPALRRDGSRISVEFTLVALVGDGGRIDGLVAVMRDQSRRFAEMKALRAGARPAG